MTTLEKQTPMINATTRAIDHSDRLARPAAAAATLLLLCGITLGVVETGKSTWGLLTQHAASPQAIVSIGAIVLLVLAVCFAALRLAKRSQPVPPTIFLAALVGGGLAIHLLLAIFVKPVWGTDYLRYWEHAQELVRRGEYGGFSGPYYSRSLFFPYPVVRLFGPEATFALKLVNIALLGSIQLFAYDILRRLRSHQAAQAGSVLLLAAPLPIYATLIPSHDLWGMFFLAAAGWTVTLALYPSSGRPRRALAWLSLAVLAGLIAFLAEIQRSTGLIFCLALLIAAVLQWWAARRDEFGPQRSRSRIGLYVALICLASLWGSGIMDKWVGLKPDPRASLVLMKIAANSGGLGNGKSDWYARFRDRFGEKQESAAVAADFARSIGLSSWAMEPLDRGAHLADQAGRLFGLGYPTDWNWLLRKPEGLSGEARALLIIYAGLFGIAFGLLLMRSVASLATAPGLPPTPLLALLITILALALSLLLLFENKPFNIFPIWFIGTLSIGWMLSPAREHAPAGPPATLQRLHVAAAGVLMIVLAAGSVLIGLRVFYGVPEGRLLADWTLRGHQALALAARDQGWQSALLDARPEAFDVAAYDPRTLKPTYINQSGEDGDRIRDHAGDTVTRLEFPAAVTAGDRIELLTKVCTPNSGRNRLEFFVYAPATSDTGAGKFSMDLSVDGKDSADVPIPFAGRNFQRFVLSGSFASGRCHDVAIRLHVLETDKSIPNSAGPYIEVWLPRLIR